MRDGRWAIGDRMTDQTEEVHARMHLQSPVANFPSLPPTSGHVRDSRAQGSESSACHFSHCLLTHAVPWLFPPPGHDVRHGFCEHGLIEQS